MRFLNYLAAACLIAGSVVAQAEPVSGLYQVREPIEGQGSDARAQATGKALDTLVLRLTGDPKAAQSPALAALRKDPQQIINRWAPKPVRLKPCWWNSTPAAPSVPYARLAWHCGAATVPRYSAGG